MTHKKNRTVFRCSSCGAEFSRWAGKCTSCESWNTIEEVSPAESSSARRHSSDAGGLPELPFLSDIRLTDIQRKPSGLDDLDTVLGGGIVPGSFVLIAGEPGVGKSTLLLEMARRFQGSFYYFSGEESPEQIRLRAERMKIQVPGLRISREMDLDIIASRLMREKPDFAVVDSIQTVYRTGSQSMPGTPNQLREAAVTFMEACKQSGVPLFITGHITRDGTVAGPKTLEHLVDCVLYFDSDRINHYRLLRAIKNRFGPVGEVAIFLMEKEGMREVRSPEMQGAADGSRSPGRVHSALMEGSRPIAAEVQALVVRAGGPPRRMADGVDTRRMILISAVIEKYLKADLSVCDIFANLAGGLNSQDPALDLAIAAAVLSSYLEITPPPYSAFCGEVGLSGEVRSVGMLDRRVKELMGIGFKNIIIPKDASVSGVPKPSGVQLIEVNHIGEVRDYLRG